MERGGPAGPAAPPTPGPPGGIGILGGLRHTAIGTLALYGFNHALDGGHESSFDGAMDCISVELARKRGVHHRRLRADITHILIDQIGRAHV